MGGVQDEFETESGRHTRRSGVIRVRLAGRMRLVDQNEVVVAELGKEIAISTGDSKEARSVTGPALNRR